MRRFTVRIVAALLLCALSSVFCVTRAGRGAAELTLDRGSVAGLVEAALPPPLLLEIPGMGLQSISLGPPREVEFEAGGIEMILPLRIGQRRELARIEVRFEPAIERLDGDIELRPVRFELIGIPALPLDLTTWVKPVALPRRLQWSLPLAGGETMQVIGFVQGLRVLEDRLELKISLSAAQRPRR